MSFCRNFRNFSGALAQLGERLLCKHQVIGSIPIGSTSFRRDAQCAFSESDMRFSVIQIDEDTRSAATAAVLQSKDCELFDIVNGFFKSMP